MNETGGALGHGRGESGQRRRERILVLLAARLVTTFKERPVRIREISSEGAMIECDVAPSEGSEVTLRRGPLDVSATVIWSDGRKCGLEFEAALDEEDFATLINPPVPIGLGGGATTRRLTGPDHKLGREESTGSRHWIVPPKPRS
jgi:hypothetical protein